MALSAASEVKICEALNITTLVLDSQITLLGSRLTSTVQAAIEAQLALWDAGAATNFTNIDPNVKNFGARLNASSARSSIRQRISILLERPDWGASGSTLVRG